jgi:ADP-ribosyl-[dinitrogen reductase] hydrolase
MDSGRFRGALLGLAVGDALGTTVEFSPPGSFQPVTDMIGGGPFKLPAGAWTDDTSMALCLAESLIEKKGFDPVDQLKKYVAWYRSGHLSSTGKLFDIGIATRTALERFEQTGEPFPGDAQPDAAGNGALMRLAPVALAYADEPTTAIDLAGEMARTTHGAPQAIDANRYFAALLVQALHGTDVPQLLKDAIYHPARDDTAPLHPEVLAVAEGSFMVKDPPAIRGQGYVVRTLEAALWALRSTRTFEEGVLAAVNLGDDADTTGAVFGQLAGALYGDAAIPVRWLEKLVMRDHIQEFADKLYELAHGGRNQTTPAGPATPVARELSGPPAAQDLPGDSFWVEPGRLLAGPYPGAATKQEASIKLNAFLDAGVTCFIDLTQEGEGPPLHLYEQLLMKLAKHRAIRVAHLRMPIRDLSIPTSWQMRAILGTLREALSEGELVYLHCWGGVGRTGTVLGCLMVENGLSPAVALERLKQLRSGTTRAHRTSPETEGQRALVAAWRPAGGTLVLDQQAINRIRPTLVSEPSPVGRDEAGRHPPTDDSTNASSSDHREFIRQAFDVEPPAVVHLTTTGITAQGGLTDGNILYLEIIDPEVWRPEMPPLTAEQRAKLERLGFTEANNTAISTPAGEDPARMAGEILARVAEEVFDIPPDAPLPYEPPDTGPPVAAVDAQEQDIPTDAKVFNGTGQQLLGTIVVPADTTISWSCPNAEETYFIVKNASADVDRIPTTAIHQTRGIDLLPAGTYHTVLVDTTAGPWRVTIG